MSPNEMTNTELIDAYLAGQLDDEARQRVEERIRTDAAFRQEVDLQRALLEQLRWRGQQELRARMQQWDAEIGDAEDGVRPLWQRPALYLAASIGAALIVAGLWLTTRSTTPSPSAETSAAGFWLPVGSASTGMGFAGDSVETDSVWTAIVPVSGEPDQYRFTDTLYLYTHPDRINPGRVRLTQDPVSGRYRLTVNDTATFLLERGFRRLRPLERSR
ncbi:hypothetical protein GCM10023187_51270 [Nibrella viscosa]|uniref:Zinc-finger domain-containing protein n=1 Tax=Nibrella viscosa TaxID=1084524 RepID=A0ABP8KX79_9BACT